MIVVAVLRYNNVPHDIKKLKNKGVPKIGVTNVSSGTGANTCGDKWIWPF